MKMEWHFDRVSGNHYRVYPNGMTVVIRPKGERVFESALFPCVESDDHDLHYDADTTMQTIMENWDMAMADSFTFEEAVFDGR